MTNQLLIKAAIALICVLFALMPDTAFAAVESQGVLNDILQRFQNEANTWGAYIKERATWLFWILVTISMVITFGFMALRKADIAEFFAEFVKFILFVGFFWWLLLSSGGAGGGMPMDIVVSMMMIGGNAGGFSGNLPQPSSIVDIGFVTFGRALASFDMWEPIDSFVAAVCGLAILVLTALIAINMMLLLVSAWILAYAGIFFLGFGGSKWTSDMALNYYKTVLGLGVQLMAMILLVGIGRNIIFEFTNNLSSNVNLNEYAVIVVVCLTLFILTNKVPQMLSGIITGASIGNTGIGSFGAGAAVGAVAGAGAAVAAGAAAMQVAGANAGGAASAIKAAFNEAQQHMQTGTGMFSAMASGGSGGGGGGSGSQDFQGGSSSGGGFSAFASAMKTGATFAADMGANLSRGMAETAKEGIAGKIDQAREAMGASSMGQVASEIKNPGEAKQERLDNKAISAAEDKQASSERKDKAAEARAFLSGGEGGGTISGSASESGGTTDSSTADNASAQSDSDTASSGTGSSETSSDAVSNASSSTASGASQQPNTDTDTASQQAPLNDEVSDFVNKSNGENRND